MAVFSVHMHARAMGYIYTQSDNNVVLPFSTMSDEFTSTGWNLGEDGM